jgi:hypothetical protein
MTRIISLTPTPQTSTLPWFLQTLITCPRCSTQFYLSPEDVQPMGGPFGTNDTVWHWWRELVEGDPTTAALDLANQRLDPAQVYGPCPICAWMIAVRGPHYGIGKTQDITTDPTAGVIQGYVTAGAAAMFWYQRDAHVSPARGWIVGAFLNASGVMMMTDGMYVTTVTRDTFTDAIIPAYSYCLHQTTAPISSAAAYSADSDLCDTLARYGLQI